MERMKVDWQKKQPGWYEATIDHYRWRIVQGGAKSWEIYEFSADGRVDHGDAGSLKDAKLWVAHVVRKRQKLVLCGDPARDTYGDDYGTWGW